MQCGGVEVRAVRPDQGLHLGIYAHLAKDRRIAQRAVQYSGEHGLEVDGLKRAVIELDTDCMRPNDLDAMLHRGGVGIERAVEDVSLGLGQHAQPPEIDSAPAAR